MRELEIIRLVENRFYFVFTEEDYNLKNKHFAICKSKRHHSLYWKFHFQCLRSLDNVSDHSERYCNKVSLNQRKLRWLLKTASVRYPLSWLLRLSVYRTTTFPNMMVNSFADHLLWIKERTANQNQNDNWGITLAGGRGTHRDLAAIRLPRLKPPTFQRHGLKFS